MKPLKQSFFIDLLKEFKIKSDIFIVIAILLFLLMGLVHFFFVKQPVSPIAVGILWLALAISNATILMNNLAQRKGEKMQDEIFELVDELIDANTELQETIWELMKDKDIKN